MNILFVLYHDFSTASAIHVHNFANCLAGKDHRVAVMVPANKESNRTYMETPAAYFSFCFGDVLQETEFLAEGETVDVIHAWTPREIVHQQCLRVAQEFPLAKLVVHLEDNEEIITETYVGMGFAQLQHVPQKRLACLIPELLSYPKEYQEFLRSADGVTVITEELLEFVPKPTKHHQLWPVIDLQRFSPQISGEAIRARYQLAEETCVLCYVGSVHGVNADEVRSLYLAVALANRQGIPVRLLRAGRDVVDFLGSARREVDEYVIELGFVDAELVPQLMAAADILVQPGRVDRFNRYRLPSKIPEFLAMGKPVVIPKANIGKSLRDGREAVLLESGDAVDIVAAIHKVRAEKKLAARLAKKGRAFAANHFSAETVTARLVRFYQEVCS